MLLNNILDILHKYRRKNWIFLRMPPVRGRELKLCYRCCHSFIYGDAPCAGARIETDTLEDPERAREDAPCAGARIETRRGSGCGRPCWDAPCAGARIETINPIAISYDYNGCPLCGGEN